MALWVNDDGLRVKYGPTETVKAVVTEVAGGSDKRVIEIVVDASRLPAVADDSVIIDDSYVVPAGVVFESVTITSDDAFDAGSGELNIGITDKDGGSTLTDVDFFVVAATVAELNAGGTNDSGWVGAGLFGTPLTEPVYLTWEVDTAAIVGGSATIRIEFSIPKTQNDSTLTPSKPYTS